MRRAEERRNASVMISNSIRWSLAGNDVDCRMKASEPRTFSWISTKISMSAKRRTTPLVRGTPIPSAIACASAGLELPAISLMEPFLADIDASPRALLDTTFSISRNPRNRRFSMGEEIPGGWLGWQPVGPVFPVKKRQIRDFYWGSLLGAVAERGGRERILGGYSTFHTRHRGTAALGGRGRPCIRGSVYHTRQPAEASLRNLAQYEVVGRRPGVAS